MKFKKKKPDEKKVFGTKGPYFFVCELTSFSHFDSAYHFHTLQNHQTS